MSHTEAVELMLRIDDSHEPPSGQIGRRGEKPVSFVGWLGLLRCLSDLLESAHGEVAASRLSGKLNPRRQPKL